jgi:hypothetical protein
MGRCESAGLVPLLLLFSGACTKLGPMPAMSGVPIAPLERPAFELQAAVVPGYYLSSTVREEPESAGLPQLLALLEPDELIAAPGVFVGGRVAGEPESGGALEPLVGYRALLDREQRFSVMGLGFVSYASGDDQGASFRALRGGGEAGCDARLSPLSPYIEVHANVGATFTLLDASGSYCLGVDGRFAVDCGGNPAQGALVAASASGVFPSGHVGLALDFGRHLRAAFHGARVAFDVAGGTMPRVVGAEQRYSEWYAAGGLSLTLGFGASFRRTQDDAHRVSAP